MSSSKRKKERRAQRKERNIRKEVEYKKSAWESGKLIEENHNQGPYSEGYSLELGDRLYRIVQGFIQECEGDNTRFLSKYRLYKNKIRDLILYWNPETPKVIQYEYLKQSLEIYWDYPNELLNKLEKL